jgi:RNA polymerase subunit RPABC4/transcription elongation factor Spt4
LTFTIPQIVITVLEGILAALGAYFVLFWFAMIVWTFQDVRRRSHDVLVQLIALILVTAFHVAGLVIYLIIRPAETLAVVQNRALEDEALLQGMEEALACPHCHKPAQPDFAVCPYCGEPLKKACVNCERLLALNWTVCPYCATPTTPPAQQAEEIAPATPVAQIQ